MISMAKRNKRFIVAPPIYENQVLNRLRDACKSSGCCRGDNHCIIRFCFFRRSMRFGFHIQVAVLSFSTIIFPEYSKYLNTAVNVVHITFFGNAFHICVIVLPLFCLYSSASIMSIVSNLGEPIYAPLLEL